MGENQGEEKKFASIPIPISLYRRIEERVRETGFASVPDYVVYVLNEVLADDKEESRTLSEEEEAEIKKRLKDLGYLG